MSDDARLASIEVELKEIRKAIVVLARVEERLVTVFKRIDNFEETNKKHNDRITAVEQNSDNNGQALRFAERIFWIVLAAGVTYIFKQGDG
jgi:hypothetical protein